MNQISLYYNIVTKMHGLLILVIIFIILKLLTLSASLYLLIIGVSIWFPLFLFFYLIIWQIGEMYIVNRFFIKYLD